MAESADRIATRREAPFLSAELGVSIATGRSANASESIETCVHQGSGN